MHFSVPDAVLGHYSFQMGEKIIGRPFLPLYHAELDKIINISWSYEHSDPLTLDINEKALDFLKNSAFIYVLENYKDKYDFYPPIIKIDPYENKMILMFQMVLRKNKKQITFKKGSDSSVGRAPD